MIQREKRRERFSMGEFAKLNPNALKALREVNPIMILTVPPTDRFRKGI